MRWQTTQIIVFMLLSALWQVGAAQGQSTVILTDSERAYMHARGPITMCVDPEWMPYERINEQGRHVGIAADYMALFSGMIDKPIDLVPTKTWAESVELAKARQCDILSLLNITPERAKFLNFTDAYIESPMVLIGRDQDPFVDGLRAMTGKTLGVVKSYVYEEFIRTAYPDVVIVNTDSVDDAMVKVSRGEIDATIGSLYIVTTRIQELGLTNLKVVGQTEYKHELRVGVRNDDAALLAAFQLAVENLAPNDENEILRRWMSVRIEHGRDYALLWQILGVALVMVGLLGYRNWVSRRYTVQLDDAYAELAEKNSQLEVQSRTDSLTGVFNRLRMDEALHEGVNQSERYTIPFACVIIDIDYFKSINDRYGHAIGDVVLVELCQVLSESVRKTDVLGRWGGEEFLISCPNTTKEGASSLAENLAENVRQFDFTGAGKVTCSFGVADHRIGENASMLVSRADDVLYEAKKAGRDCIRVSD